MKNANPMTGVLMGCLMLLSANCLCAQDWPQWRGPNRDGVWRETGIVQKFAASQLTPKWRVEVGTGYCGPTVANGRVYLTDRLTKPSESERVHCFDEKTGSRLWSHEYDCPYGRIGYPAGPRASVTVHDGKAYALGATGRLHEMPEPKWRDDDAVCVVLATEGYPGPAKAGSVIGGLDQAFGTGVVVFQAGGNDVDEQQQILHQPVLIQRPERDVAEVQR